MNSAIENISMHTEVYHFSLYRYVQLHQVQ